MLIKSLRDNDVLSQNFEECYSGLESLRVVLVWKLYLDLNVPSCLGPVWDKRQFKLRKNNIECLGMGKRRCENALRTLEEIFLSDRDICTTESRLTRKHSTAFFLTRGLLWQPNNDSRYWIWTGTKVIPQWRVFMVSSECLRKLVLLCGRTAICS